MLIPLPCSLTFPPPSVPLLVADGRITFDEWLTAMSGSSHLTKQREERMIEKRRRVTDDPLRTPSHASRKVVVEEEEKQAPPPTAGTTPLIVAVN